MKTNLKTLAVTLLLSLTTFSQQDITNNNKPLSIHPDSVLCLPIGTARLIAIDLVKYDECKELNALQQETLDLQYHKIITIEALLAAKETQYSLSNKQTVLLSEKVKIYEDSNTKLAEKNRKLKKLNTALLSVTGFAATVITTLLLVK